MPHHISPRLSGIAIASVSIVLLSCESPEVSGPLGALSSAPRANLGSCTSGTATVIPPSIAPVPLCDFGPSPVLVELTFAGLITVTPQGSPAYTTDPRGRAWGFGSCVEGVRALSNTDGPWLAGPCTQTGSPPAAGYAMVRDAVNAQWMGPIPNGPDQQSAYSGSFTVTYTRVTGTGSVKADKYVLQGPGSVTFTASVNPVTVGGGVRVPFSLRWRWVPNQPGGSDPAQNCGPWLVCTTTVSASGTMFADFVINEDPSSQSVPIAVNTCPPTSDPWIDNPEFRKKLDDDLAASNPNGAIPSGRSEVPGSWWTDNSTGQPFYVPLPSYTSTNCGFDGTWPSVPGATPGVATHTHPYTPWEPVATCGTQAMPPGSRYLPGVPSSRDWQNVNNLSPPGSPPVIGCAIEVGRIFCYPPNVPPGQRSANVTKYKKQANGCYARQP